MKKLLLLVLVGCGGYYAYTEWPRFSSKPLIEERTDHKISSAVGDHHWLFYKGQDVDEAGMLFGCEVGDKSAFHQYCHASMSMIPEEKVIQLRKKYPDFDQCKSLGAAEAQQSVQNLILIAADTRIQHLLKKVENTFWDEIKGSQRRVIVRMKGTQITNLGQEPGGHEESIPSLFVKCYLVRDITYEVAGRTQ